MSETTLTIGPWTYRRHKEDWQYQTYGGDWLDVPNAPHALTLDALAARERELAEAERAMREVACPIENCEDQEAKFICFNENADAIIEADTLADAISQIARCWELESERAEALRARLAARERELAEARKSAESFEQEAAYRAQNTDYWQGIAEQARADLAAVEAKRMEAVQVLRALWNDATGGKKACEHEFTCNCAGDLARALLAREADDAE